MPNPPADHAFQKKYAALNPAQREAVDAIDGPVMVVAGPGTGKTTILTLRIANILRQTDTPPHGILAITYTDAGVKAMRAKLRDVIGNRAHEVAIHTFHSFASAMIAEYPDHFLHLEGLKNLTAVEQESMIRTILLDPAFRDLRPLGKPDAYLLQIMGAIDEAKREALTPEMVRQNAEREAAAIRAADDSISTRGATKGKLKAEALEAIAKCERTALFSQVYERYESAKRESKRMDFNDLIIELLFAFRNDELLLRLVQERFLYLLVDEHQDTNDSQNLIIRAIAEFFDSPNVFIVGDEKQAIYRFQGASVDNFLSLRKQWPAMRAISLESNYRSHQHILDASFSMIEQNYGQGEYEDLRMRLMAEGEEKPRLLDIVEAGNSAAAEAYLVQEVKGILEREPHASVALITRRNRDLERILRVLESAHIPVSSERSVDIFHHPVGAVFFDLIEFLADPSRVDCLGSTLAAGLWGVPFAESVALFKSLRSGQAADLDKRIPALARLRVRMNEDGAVAFTIHAAELSGYGALLSRDPAAIHVWRGIVALAQSLTREGGIASPLELLKSMLAYRLSAESKTVKVAVGAPDLAVRAMTAHGSKGLEFDYVFIPYATEEAWVGRARGRSFVLPSRRAGDDDIRDVRRLFYVALTRAKKHVVVMTPLQESDGKELTPLRFIAELDPKTVSRVKVPRAELGLPQADRGQTTRASEVAALAKRSLLENGLSVTALNHFLECPSKFLYLSILKLPQAPSVPAEKGTAMHEAIARVWHADGRTAESAEILIKEAVAEYLNGSFLSVAEKEMVKEELFENAPAVARALVPHWNGYPGAQISTERWIQAPFEASYRDARLPVPLHGKLDAIVDTGSELHVFDYKTRKAMSENEIKGATKNSNGDYFRQLVFYRILLEGEPRWRGRRISPALVFVTPDEKGRCPITALPIAPDDIDAVKKDIQTLVESVWSGEFVSKKCDDPDCEWCGLAGVSF